MSSAFVQQLAGYLSATETRSGEAIATQLGLQSGGRLETRGGFTSARD